MDPRKGKLLVLSKKKDGEKPFSFAKRDSPAEQDGESTPFGAGKFSFGKKAGGNGGGGGGFKFSTAPDPQSPTDPVAGGDSWGYRNATPSFSLAAKKPRATAVKKRSAFEVEQKAVDLDDSQYDAAFGVMPVPYGAVAIAIDFGMTFNAVQFVPLRGKASAPSYTHKFMVDTLMELSRSPGSWRDAVVSSELAWAYPEGPLGGKTWSLNSTIPGVLLQSIEHYPERVVKIPPFVTKKRCEEFVKSAPGIQCAVLEEHPKATFSAEEMALLPQLPLTTLTTNVTENLGKFEKLTHLNLTHQRNPHDLSKFQHLAETLETLVCCHIISEIPGQSLVPLAGFSRLTELGILGQHNWNSGSLQKLPPLPQLEVLRWNTVTVDDANYFSQLPKLRELECRELVLASEDGAPEDLFQALGRLPKFSRLSISVVDDWRDGEVLAPLATKLTYLRIVPSRRRPNLSKCPALTNLHTLEVPLMSYLVDLGQELSKWSSLKAIRIGTQGEGLMMATRVAYGMTGHLSVPKHLTADDVQEFEQAAAKGEITFPGALEEVVLDARPEVRSSAYSAITRCVPVNVRVVLSGGHPIE